MKNTAVHVALKMVVTSVVVARPCVDWHGFFRFWVQSPLQLCLLLLRIFSDSVILIILDRRQSVLQCTFSDWVGLTADLARGRRGTHRKQRLLFATTGSQTFSLFTHYISSLLYYHFVLHTIGKLQKKDIARWILDEHLNWADLPIRVQVRSSGFFSNWLTRMSV